MFAFGRESAGSFFYLVVRSRGVTDDRPAEVSQEFILGNIGDADGRARIETVAYAFVLHYLLDAFVFYLFSVFQVAFVSVKYHRHSISLSRLCEGL